ncbi:N-acetylmuramoyl-L-alanine amidase [Streptomyces sp. NPDC001851]|uniref:N-acetylmuramoyl-L-alanine amidase n=1 Tax=Streptomyces sp. NPDC001851 TaxID=3154529 RepID=UPI003330DA36
MARMPGAVWRPVVNAHKNGVLERRGLVLHVQAGTNSPFGFFNNPAKQVSSDFWVSTMGRIEQYVETGVDYAFAQHLGNPYYASVETEGHPDTPLTPAQVEGVAHIYAWGNSTFGWPLHVVDSTTQPGLTWHGVGGDAWGGHPHCPGDKRKAQRGRIIDRATEILGLDTDGEPSIDLGRLITLIRSDPEAAQGRPTYPEGVRLVEGALHAEGLLDNINDDRDFECLTITAYAAWQRLLGYEGDAADGVPDQVSLTKLGRRHGFTVTA